MARRPTRNTNANTRLMDASVRHQIFLLRFAGASAKKLVKLLDDADKDVARQLQDRLDRLGPLDRQQVGQGLATTRRLQAMQREFRRLNAEVREAMRRELRSDLAGLSEQEVDIAVRRLEEATRFGGVNLEALRPAPDVTRALVDGAVVRGQTLRESFKSLSDARLRRLNSEVSLGVVENQTTPQIIRRVRETLKVSHRHAEALSRTAVNSVGNQSRELLYERNKDVVKSLRYTATLDSRTTLRCQSLDGRIFPVNEGPRPPQHVNCRSVVSPVTRSWSELAEDGALQPGRGADDIDTLFRRKLKEQGIPDDQIPLVMRNARASMNGQVPRTLSYNDWLKTQPDEFQDEVLGPTKGKLFRDSGLGVDKFVDLKTGRPFTLDDIRRKNEAAWMRAGLDDEQ